MKIYLVGGAVRDMILQLPHKERDYVVVGATPEDLHKQGFKQVGKEFPVFLHPKTGEEYALARAERKVKPGYTGFIFNTSPHVSLEEDLKRRDLTINAMAYDLTTGEIIDPFGGRTDAYERILRHVSDAFAEDPVRILRVGRFLARFAHLGFSVHKDTVQLMRQMVAAGEVEALVAERVWKELERALTEKNPEQFFYVLEKSNALSILFPSISTTSVGMRALIIAATMSKDPRIRFAALLHQGDMLSTNDASIKSLSKKFKIPKNYTSLALLTATHYQTVFQFNQLNPEARLKLFLDTDSFRRESRFYDFLITCEAISKAHGIDFTASPLRTLLSQLKQIDIRPLLAAGFTNSHLANAINQERLTMIRRSSLEN